MSSTHDMSYKQLYEREKRYNYDKEIRLKEKDAQIKYQDEVINSLDTKCVELEKALAELQAKYNKVIPFSE